MVINFLEPATDQENTDEIETEADIGGSRSELLHLLDPRQDLGNSEKNTDSGCNQCNTPDQLEAAPVVRHKFSQKLQTRREEQL
jgi:hypothetical protein